MNINFAYQQNGWLDSEVLASGKSFMAFDVNFKHIG